MDGHVSTFVVHNRDICSLTRLGTKVTVAQMKAHYLEVMRSIEHRAEEYLPAEPSGIRFYLVKETVVDSTPLGDDQTWDSLKICAFPEDEEQCPKENVWPEEILLATFALPDGSWEPAVFPAVSMEGVLFDPLAQQLTGPASEQAK